MNIQQWKMWSVCLLHPATFLTVLPRPQRRFKLDTHTHTESHIRLRVHWSVYKDRDLLYKQVQQSITTESACSFSSSLSLPHTYIEYSHTKHSGITETVVNTKPLVSPDTNNNNNSDHLSTCTRRLPMPLTHTQSTSIYNHIDKMKVRKQFLFVVKLYCFYSLCKLSLSFFKKVMPKSK